ncbi:MAG: T9SS type A sorting domain-containing protein [Crocinitomicaceae bacterium]|nr:T9SS type A sorting domain-containing protein [Crocinitomicaceae bacterium]
MKYRYLLVGTVTTAMLASFAFLSPFQDGEVDGKYAPRKSSKLDGQKRNANDALEYRNVLQRNPWTGVVDIDDVQRARAIAENRSRAGIITWDEEGPYNIGGRTRAIQVDVNNQYTVYAGSVSGGLWVSGSRGNYWVKVESFADNLAVSSICQTKNGALVVATGHFAEGIVGYSGGDSGAYGYGLYVYPTGDINTAPTLVAGTESWTFINEVICDTINNLVWIMNSSGVWTYNTDNGTLTDVSSTVGSSNSSAGVISKDGQVLCIANQSRQAKISLDGGSTFFNAATTGSNTLPNAQGRVEYSISHERYNGEYFIYALNAAGDGTFQGAYVSSNSGQDWYEIAPNSNGGSGAFNPFNSQGRYDNITTVVPGHPEKAFIGGIDIYGWIADPDNPTFGSWNQNTNWAANPTSPIYAHADQHEMKWDNMGRLYIGNDGGVGYSDDEGQTFIPANRGYNVTQFYSVAYSAHGDVLGGAQDNGSLYNDHTNFQWQDFAEILGGDGFDCDISQTNRNMVFTTLYYSGLFRSSDAGFTQYPFYPQQLAASLTPGSVSGPGNFNTVIRFHEVYDLNSTDSVYVIPSQGYSMGDTIIVESNSTGDSILYIAPDTIRFEDTVYYDPNIYVIEYTVTDCISSANRDLGIEHPWTNLNSGNYPPDLGDSIILYNDPIDISDDDTIIVCDTIPYRFYYATDPISNDTIAMHIDSVLYNVAWDTIKAQDPYVSWLALGIGTGRWVNNTQRDLGIWMTRYAKRFSDNIGANEIWLNVVPQVGSSEVQCMEFSRNGDFLYVGTRGGDLFRLSGFNQYYASTPGIVDSLQGWSIVAGNGSSTANWDLIWSAPGGGFQVVTGIGVDYNSSSPDGDHLVVCLGGFGNFIHAYEITNASTCGVGGANASAIHAAGEIQYPVYDAIIDREDPNFVALATEYGVLATSNVSAGSVLWENSSDGFGLAPVHALRQDWRTWNEGSRAPGKIYAGTHGRGIWSSSTLLAMPDDMNIGIEKETFKTNLLVYPNPMVSTGFLKFDLDDNADVYVNVYSLSGKLVMNVSKSGMPKGNNIIDFNVSRLPIGTYLIEFVAGDHRETAKFIKAR